MAEILKEKRENVLHVRLVGVVDEKTNFRQELGIPPREIHVNCRQVSRLNSMGIKAWIQYFGAAADQGTKIKFSECTVPIVEQLNSISNFATGAEVESFFVPFCCTNCDAEVYGLFKSESLRRTDFKVADQKCPKCGGKAIFDDDPDYYFLFLMR